jgi:effector-binding domain-containing protein
VIHVRVPRDRIKEAMCPAITEVMEAVQAQGIGPAGPIFSHHARMEPDVFDFEVGVPVSGPVTPTGRVKAGELPARTVMRCLYTGPVAGLGQAWGHFIQKLDGDSHHLAPALWERYLADPEENPDSGDWTIELNQTLA